MIDSYQILSESFVIEEEYKKSRFITYVFSCSCYDSMKLALTKVKVDYPDARHYCYAFVGSEPGNMVNCGSSDDGEPAGSAGRPMLAVLQGSNVGEIGIIVVRYFGGTKLGVGGLVRAYTGGIKRALPQLITETKLLKDQARLTCDYAQLSDVEYLLNKHQAVIENKTFDAQVGLNVAIPKSAKQQIQTELVQLSQGQLQFSFVEKE
ncbi:MAG: YigZ family protein [Parashewanella sp.]